MEDPELQKIIEKKLKVMQEAKPAQEMDHPIDLTREDFLKTINSNKPVIVDFWAEWCGPCHAMHPVVQRLASKYAGKVIFGRLNVDAYSDLAARYQVYSIPTFILFRLGKPMDSVIGAVGESGLERLISRNLE